MVIKDGCYLEARCQNIFLSFFFLLFLSRSILFFVVDIFVVRVAALIILQLK